MLGMKDPFPLNRDVEANKPTLSKAIAKKKRVGK